MHQRCRVSLSCQQCPSYPSCRTGRRALRQCHAHRDPGTIRSHHRPSPGAFHQDPLRLAQGTIHSRLRVFHAHQHAHRHLPRDPALRGLPQAVAQRALVGSGQALRPGRSARAVPVLRPVPVDLAVPPFHLRVQALDLAALQALRALELQAQLQLGAVVQVAVVPPEPSGNKVESRIKLAKVRNYAVKNSTICKRRNWVV